MTSQLLIETVIPHAEGRAFELRAGQVLRLIAIDGKQVGDLAAWALDNHDETLSVIFSTTMNGRSTGNVQTLFSGPPFFNPMLTIASDSHGVHWLGGRCNRFIYEAMGAPGHRNCHDNILEATAPFGVDPAHVTLDTLNVFMNVIYEPRGSFSFAPPVIEKGDFVDFHASMDLLIAVSACPNEGDFGGEINDGVAKPLKVEIYSEA
jgi:uncharacterized protein YcgI (DUF1989 family)